MSGTPFYASPEMLNKRSYTFNNDVWQLGVVMYHMACLKLPYEGKTINDIKLNQKMTQPRPLPIQYSQQLRWIINQMMEYSMSKRMTPKQLLQSLSAQKWIKILFHQSSLFFGQKLLVLDKETSQPIEKDKLRFNNEISIKEIKFNIRSPEGLRSLFP